MNRGATQILSWLKEHEKEIVYAGGMIIVGATSFVFGVLKGSEIFSHEPITVIESTTESVTLPCTTDREDENLNMSAQDCVYVGSTKGEKYYPPSCSYAKNIKKENLRCFRSDADAQEKGYQRSASCD